MARRKLNKNRISGCRVQGAVDGEMGRRSPGQMAIAMAVENCGWKWKRMPLAMERVSSDWPFDRRARTAGQRRRQRNRQERESDATRGWRDARSGDGERGDVVGEGVDEARVRSRI